jgi:hypothetical protein
MTSIRGSASKPPRRKGSQHMTVPEQGHMAFNRMDPRNHAIYPSVNLLGTFPTRTAVGEHHPPGVFCVDLLWS